MLNFEILSNGDLKISVDDQMKWFISELVSEFSDAVNEIPIAEERIMKALVESSNKYRYFDSNDTLTTEYGISAGLTNCPVIVDGRDNEYEYEFDELSKMWGYMDYQLRLCTDDLIEHGLVIFKYAGTDEENAE